MVDDDHHAAAVTVTAVAMPVVPVVILMRVNDRDVRGFRDGLDGRIINEDAG